MSHDLDEASSLGVAISHHWIADEVISARYVIPAGLSIPKHMHTYDHASALVRGTVRLTVDGESREVTGPAILLIEAGKMHHVQSMTEVVWHCLHIDQEAT